MKKRLLVALLILLLSCTPMGSIRPGDGTTFRITGRDYEEIWEVVMAVIDEHFFLVAKDKAMGTVKAEEKAGAITGGDIVSLYITPARPGETRYTIEITRLRQAVVPITKTNWESKMMTEIKFRLGI